MQMFLLVRKGCWAWMSAKLRRSIFSIEGGVHVKAEIQTDVSGAL